MSQPINLLGRIRPIGDRLSQRTGHTENSKRSGSEFTFTESETTVASGCRSSRRPSGDFFWFRPCRNRSSSGSPDLFWFTNTSVGDPPKGTSPTDPLITALSHLQLVANGRCFCSTCYRRSLEAKYDLRSFVFPLTRFSSAIAKIFACLPI